MIRTAGWVALFGTSLYVEDRIPAGTPMAVAAVGLFDVAKTIYAQCRRKIPTFTHVEREQSFSSFNLRMPANLLGMTQKELATYNANEPVKYSVEGGGRVGISIDASCMGIFQVQCHLRYLFEKYPQASRIEIVNYHQSKGNELVKEIVRFEGLSKLSFKHCPEITEDTVIDILEKNRAIDRLDKSIRIKQFDLRGCATLNVSFCNRLATEYDLMMTFPDATSNEEAMVQGFYQDVKKKSQEVLMQMIAAKQRELADIGNGALTVFTQRLQDRRGSKEAFLAAFDHVSDLLDPAKFDGPTRTNLLSDVQQRAKRVRERKDLAVLDNPFKLSLRKLIATDEMLEPFLIVFQKINAYLVELDVSDSFLTGQFLRRLKGLPVATLALCRLRKLSSDALEQLSGMSDLTHLDLSDSPLIDAGLLKGVKRLPRVAVLRLNGCERLSEVALRKTMSSLISRTLEHLSLERVVVRPELITFLIQRGGEDPSKPFMITSTFEGKRRLDISKTLIVDEALVHAIQRAQGEGPIQALGFGTNTELSVQDINQLIAQPFLQIEHLDLSDVKIDDVATHMLGHHWPLKRVLLADTEIVVEKQKIIVKAKQFSEKLHAFLGGTHFTELRLEIRFFGGKSKKPEDKKTEILRLVDLCEAKRGTALELVDSNLVNDDFEDMIAAPNNLMQRLMSACRSITFVAGSVTSELLKEWKGPSDCVLTFPDGSRRVFPKNVPAG